MSLERIKRLRDEKFRPECPFKPGDIVKAKGKDIPDNPFYSRQEAEKEYYGYVKTVDQYCKYPYVCVFINENGGIFSQYMREGELTLVESFNRENVPDAFEGFCIGDTIKTKRSPFIESREDNPAYWYGTILAFITEAENVHCAICKFYNPLTRQIRIRRIRPCELEFVKRKNSSIEEEIKILTKDISLN